MMRRFLPFIFSVLFLAGCAGITKDGGPDPIPDLRLSAVSFDDLNIPEAQKNGFLKAFRISCLSLMKRSPDKTVSPEIPAKTENGAALRLGGVAGDWFPACQAVSKDMDDVALDAFLREHFNAYQVYDGARDQTGLFTGYYEPLLFGSKVKTKRFHYPLYERPSELIDVDLGAFREDLKGMRIAGKVEGKKFVPFADRSEIDEGALKGRGLEILYVDDPIKAFFLHIQGSGVVEFPNGKRQRVGYAGQNGHLYYAIGRRLIDDGVVAKEDMSLQVIDAWLRENPDKAEALMWENPSYILFRKLDGDAPLGAQGVPLTPYHSLAVDRRLIPYGMPVLLSYEDAESKNTRTLMMVAQDTGGAIRGAVRGDVFWGAGDTAEQRAGTMKAEGSYVIFVPNTVAVPEKWLTRGSLNLW